MTEVSDLLQVDFFTNPLARRTDPATSKDAAREYTKTRRRTDLEIMLKLVAEHPGRTVGEYAQILYDNGVDFYRAANLPRRRLSELVDLKLIERGEPRQCKKTRKQAATHYPKP